MNVSHHTFKTGESLVCWALFYSLDYYVNRDFGIFAAFFTFPALMTKFFLVRAIIHRILAFRENRNVVTP